MLRKSTLAAMLIVATGSTVAPAADDPMKTAEDLTAQWVAAYNQKAADKLAAMFLADGVYISRFGTLKGRAAIQAALESGFKAGWSHANNEAKGASGSGDVVWDYGTFDISGTSDKGPISLQGDWSGVLVKDATGWRIATLTAVPKPVKQ